MARMPSGLRKAAGGWRDPFYRKPEPKVVEVVSPEQQARSQKVREDFLRGMAPVWGVAPEDVDLWINDTEAYAHKMNQQRALTKIVDREARVAVEGDTDMNHDNVEAAE